MPLIIATNKTYLKTPKKFHLPDLQARSKSNGGVKTINNNLESSSQRIDQSNCCDSNPQILKNQAMGQAGNSAKSTLIQPSTNQGTKGKFMGKLGSGLREWWGDFFTKLRTPICCYLLLLFYAHIFVPKAIFLPKGTSPFKLIFFRGHSHKQI